MRSRCRSSGRASGPACSRSRDSRPRGRASHPAPGPTAPRSCTGRAGCSRSPRGR
jgi:hypothetical protein